VCGVHTVCADKNGTHRPPRHQPRSGTSRAAAPAAQRHQPHSGGTHLTGGGHTQVAAATHGLATPHPSSNACAASSTRAPTPQPVCRPPRHTLCAGHRRQPVRRPASPSLCHRRDPCPPHPRQPVCGVHTRCASDNGTVRAQIPTAHTPRSSSRAGHTQLAAAAHELATPHPSSNACAASSTGVPTPQPVCRPPRHRPCAGHRAHPVRRPPRHPVRRPRRHPVRRPAPTDPPPAAPGPAHPRSTPLRGLGTFG
jgi:hypothetical protein